MYRLPEQSIDLLDYYDFDDPLDVQFLHETLLRVWQDHEPFWAEKSLPLFFAAQKCATATGDHPLRVLARWVQLAAPTAMAEARLYAPVEVGQFLDTDDPTAPINRTAQSAWATLVTRYTRLVPHIDTVTTATVPASWMADGGTVYITYPLDQLSMAGSLVAAIVGAFVKAKMRAETSGQPTSFTLFALDEMPTTAIPRLDEYLSIMGGFGATALLYMQSLAQLDEVYGHDRARTILANCHQQVYYPPRDVPTAEYVSKLFGTELQFVESDQSLALDRAWAELRADANDDQLSGAGAAGAGPGAAGRLAREHGGDLCARRQAIPHPGAALGWPRQRSRSCPRRRRSRACGASRPPRWRARRRRRRRTSAVSPSDPRGSDTEGSTGTAAALAATPDDAAPPTNGSHPQHTGAAEDGAPATDPPATPPGAAATTPPQQEDDAEEVEDLEF